MSTPIIYLFLAKICKNPEKFKGEKLYYLKGAYCIECVSFVKQCTKDYRTTNQWKPGKKVQGNKSPHGTAIATFPGGKYQGHAAIYVGQTSNGIQLWDQWVGHPVNTRTIPWNGGSSTSHKGKDFYVID